MNQHADSLKINLQPIVAKPRIHHSGWLLSHTMRRSEGEAAKNPNEGTLAGVAPSAPASVFLPFRASAPPALSLQPTGPGEQNESSGGDVCLREQHDRCAIPLRRLSEFTRKDHARTRRCDRGRPPLKRGGCTGENT